MNIYELTGEYKNLELAVMLNPDDESFKEEFEKINDEIEVKADNYAKIIKNMEAESEGYKKESKRLEDRAKIIDKNIEALKANLKWSMEQTNKLKFKTDLFAFGVVGNGGLAPLEVTVKPEELPEELQKITVAPDNMKIRKYIEETGDLSYGFFRDRGTRLSIR